MIRRWQKSGKPVRLIVTGTPINYGVTIRNFTFEERGGSPGDVSYTLDLKEYAYAGVTQSAGTTAATSAAKPAVTVASVRTSAKETPSSYTVKTGDSLFKIAAKVYGDGDKWRTIYDKNKALIGANPNSIKAGQKLVIPSGGQTNGLI